MSTVADSPITEQHVAGIVGTGSISVTFTPKAGADTDVQTKGIKMVATVQVTKVGERQWNGKNILTVVADPTITLNGGDAGLSATIPAKEIIEKLILCEGDTVKLDTKSDYDAFQAALSDYQIHILISEA